MNKDSISIATITWARDEEEEQLLRLALQQLAEFQIPVFITDGGSKPEFINFLRGFPHFTTVEAKAKGVWPQAKTSLLAAFQSGSDFILYTEPDKHNFFQNDLPTMLDEVSVDNHAGVVLASRSAAGFATFPAFQQMTETTINNCCTEVIGSAADYTYGPFILNRKLIPYLQELQDEIGWGWRPYLFCISKRLNYKIEYYVKDFSCPPDQREDTEAERIYRMKQLYQNIQAIVQSTSASLNKE